MKRNTCTKILFFLSFAFIVSENAKSQNFPSNGEISEEIAIGGPSIDYLTLQFPRPGVDGCTSISNETRSIGGDLQKYGKALLVVIFPKDCPYCIEAADQAGAVIDKYRSKLTLWYVNQRLNGDGSCADIAEMKSKYPFVKGADFSFVDVYMWNNAWGTPWHYGEQDSYFTRKESPSVYRIFNPKTKKVTGIDYNVGVIESQIQAAIKDNTIATETQSSQSNLSSYELFPNPAKETLNLNINLFDAGNTVVSISNALGKEVMRKNIGSAHNYTEQLDIQNLPNDIYMISVISNGNTIIHDKFIKN